MPHSPLDLYGQFRFLDPTVFGTSFTRMRARYAITDPVFPSKVVEWRNQQELSKLLDENSWRVTADEVLDLPSTLHERIEVDLRPKTRAVYDAFENEMVADIDTGVMTASNALTKLLRLQQVTSGYCHIDGGFDMTLISGTPEKALALESMLEDLPATEPVVVFCRFRHDLREVEAMARRLGRPYSEVSGETKTLEEWQRGDTTILGVQIQSGGAGIDLTRAAYCVYYSLGFSLGDYDQSLARLHRPGQTRCVRYYHLVANATIDGSVYRALKNRRDVIDGVLDQLTQRAEEAA
jgi:SNF2 family DNA or RNA helicase